MLEQLTERATLRLAGSSSRRSFLGRLGSGVVALVGGPFVAVALSPERAEAHHICGHTFTTGSCPHPFAPRTRVDGYGKPLHPKFGYPVDDRGRPYTSRRQTRRKVCEQVVRDRYPYTGRPVLGFAWARCCNGRVRRIRDCCSYSRRRINGDRSFRGYCPGRRRVFCIAYRDTNVRC